MQAQSKLKTPPIYALILAGGQSSRLFPFNKVLSDLTGTGKSLIQQSYLRLGLPKENVFVLTAKEMVRLIAKQLPLKRSHYLTDPVRRGTWPAILWAMAHLKPHAPDATIALVTADHVIQGDKAFRDALHQATALASRERAMVMLGIAPGNDPQVWSSFGCFKVDPKGEVAAFEEKPSLERALHMIDEGSFHWNSGMFFFRVSTAEEALRAYQPKMYKIYEKMCALVASKRKAAAAALFADFPDKITHPADPTRQVDNSIDYAILTPLVQKSLNGVQARAVCNVAFHWTDLGQWSALRQVNKADAHGNIRIGRVIVGQDVRDSILVAAKGMAIRASGLQDAVIAWNGERALVMPLRDLSRIKEIALAAVSEKRQVVVENLEGILAKTAGKRLIVSRKPGFIR